MKKLYSILCISVSMLIMQSCNKDSLNQGSPAASINNLKQSNVTQAFSVAKLLGSNMVVQRAKPFKVWGQASTGETVSVKVSWNETTFTGVTNGTGDWEVIIPAAAATETPQTIVISANGVTPVTFTDVLIGDVWVCSGQSNMVMPLDSVSPWPGFPGVIDYKTEIPAANYPNVRLMATPYSRPSAPLEYVKTNGAWKVCTPENAKNFSALAYYFGRSLNTTLKVPVGLVVSAVAATSCQEWTSRETIGSNAFYSATPNVSTLYNGMIYPLRKLSIKGFIWDQGENNRKDPRPYYTYLNAAMIENWRQLFNQGTLPFYFVNRTPQAHNFFNTNPWGDDPTKTDYALFRQDQADVRKRTTNIGMAVTMDINETINLHYKNKRIVGERLARLVLNQTFGIQAAQCFGPQMQSVVQVGNKGIVNFVPGTAEGLRTDGKALKQYFFMAGPDRVFRKATASIKGNTVELLPPPGMPLPVLSVRYAFTNFPVTNLQNSAGLPAEPFRTDNWAQ